LIEKPSKEHKTIRKNKRSKILNKKSSTSIVLKKVQKNPEILKQAIENLSLAVNILEFIGSENVAYRKTIKKIVEDWDQWMVEK